MWTKQDEDAAQAQDCAGGRHKYVRLLNPGDRPAWACAGCGLDQPDHDAAQR